MKAAVVMGPTPGTRVAEPWAGLRTRCSKWMRR